MVIGRFQKREHRLADDLIGYFLSITAIHNRLSACHTLPESDNGHSGQQQVYGSDRPSSATAVATGDDR